MLTCNDMLLLRLLDHIQTVTQLPSLSGVTVSLTSRLGMIEREKHVHMPI